MLTSLAARRSTRPVLPSITPLIRTDPFVEVADNDPPLIDPVVRSPDERIVIGAVPEIRPLPAATVAAPLVAVRPIEPLLVSSDSLTPRLRDAFSVTAPPAAPPRPSTIALTFT